VERIAKALSQRAKQGFTLIEVLVVAPLLLIVITVMGSILISMYGTVVVESHKVLLRAEAQKLAATLTAELQDTIVFASSLDRSTIDDFAPEDGWSFNSSPAPLITKSILHNNPANAVSPKPIYRLPDCTSEAVISTVFFIQENDTALHSSLYQRVIAPRQDTLCSSSNVSSTCPANNLAASCKEDTLLSSKIESFSTTYLDENNNILPVYDTANDLTPERANSILVSFTLSEIAYGKTVKESAEIRIHRHGR
jgi:type II secretory pathway pseudopilin PulG